MNKNKTLFVQSKAKPFQPKDAWSTDLKISGVPVSVLENKIFESKGRMLFW